MFVVNRTKGEKVFDAINVFLIFILIIVTLYPFYYVIAASFSDPTELFRSPGAILWPRGFSLDSYRIVLTNQWIWSGYRNTFIYILTGGSLGLFLTFIGGYALSKKFLPGRSFFLTMIIIPMFFGGGMIPTWLVIRSLNMLDTRWALILPGAVGTFNLIIMKTFLASLPEELEESAFLDGASYWKLLWAIVAPLSKPALAVIGLFYAVAIWNSFMPGLIYLSGRVRHLLPLQNILREILIEATPDTMNLQVGGEEFTVYSETVRHASVIVTTIPILMVYPFLQRYFVKGVMIGSIKG